MADVRRLKWYCRRGMKELDVLLDTYLEKAYPHAPVEEQQAFSTLLECGDMQLMAWLLRGDQPDDDTLTPIVNAVCTCYQTHIKSQT